MTLDESSNLELPFLHLPDPHKSDTLQYKVV